MISEVLTQDMTYFVSLAVDVADADSAVALVVQVFLSAAPA